MPPPANSPLSQSPRAPAAIALPSWRVGPSRFVVPGKSASDGARAASTIAWRVAAESRMLDPCVPAGIAADAAAVADVADVAVVACAVRASPAGSTAWPRLGADSGDVARGVGRGAGTRALEASGRAVIGCAAGACGTSRRMDTRTLALGGRGGATGLGASRSHQPTPCATNTQTSIDVRTARWREAMRCKRSRAGGGGVLCRSHSRTAEAVCTAALRQTPGMNLLQLGMPAACAVWPGSAAMPSRPKRRGPRGSAR